MPIWKIYFCSRFLRLYVALWCRDRPQIDTCCLEWLGRLKRRSTGLDAALSSFSTSPRCFRNRSLSRLPVSPMHNFCRIQTNIGLPLTPIQQMLLTLPFYPTASFDRVIGDLFRLFQYYRLQNNTQLQELLRNIKESTVHFISSRVT